VFYADGTIMLVWIPTYYMKGKGANMQRIDIKGVIAYWIYQQRRLLGVSAQVISEEDYVAKYGPVDKKVAASAALLADYYLLSEQFSPWEAYQAVLRQNLLQIRLQSGLNFFL